MDELMRVVDDYTEKYELKIVPGEWRQITKELRSVEECRGWEAHMQSVGNRTAIRPAGTGWALFAMKEEAK